MYVFLIKLHGLKVSRYVKTVKFENHGKWTEAVSHKKFVKVTIPATMQDLS